VKHVTVKHAADSRYFLTVDSGRHPDLTFSLFNAIVPLSFGEPKVGKKTAMINGTND
jgi:hypothetical protein